MANVYDVFIKDLEGARSLDVEWDQTTDNGCKTIGVIKINPKKINPQWEKYNKQAEKVEEKGKEYYSYINQIIRGALIAFGLTTAGSLFIPADILNNISETIQDNIQLFQGMNPYQIQTILNMSVSAIGGPLANIAATNWKLKRITNKIAEARDAAVQVSSDTKAAIQYALSSERIFPEAYINALNNTFGNPDYVLNNPMKSTGSCKCVGQVFDQRTGEVTNSVTPGECVKIVDNAEGVSPAMGIVPDHYVVFGKGNSATIVKGSEMQLPIHVKKRNNK